MLIALARSQGGNSAVSAIAALLYVVPAVGNFIAYGGLAVGNASLLAVTALVVADWASHFVA
jgi:hypothetical protein